MSLTLNTSKRIRHTPIWPSARHDSCYTNKLLKSTINAKNNLISIYIKIQQLSQKIVTNYGNNYWILFLLGYLTCFVFPSFESVNRKTTTLSQNTSKLIQHLKTQKSFFNDIVVQVNSCAPQINLLSIEILWKNTKIVKIRIHNSETVLCSC